MPPTRVIIDTDPGVDDVLAILLALTHPSLEILAYVVTYGNTDVDASYTNILKLYRVLDQHFDKHPDDRKRFPNYSQRPYIARGPTGPFEGVIHGAQYFHGRDGLGDITNTHKHIETPSDDIAHKYLQPSDKAASTLALELIQQHEPGSITYIALGPLTNFATMMREDPVTCKERLGRVVSMGGALDVPGNATPVAEFNFFADPFAVHELLSPTSPNRLPVDKFFLAPLDITTPHELPFPIYETKVDPLFATSSQPQLVTNSATTTTTQPAGPTQPTHLQSHLNTDPHATTWHHPKPLHHFTSAFFERTRAVMLDYGKDAMELHDVVAVWFAAENPIGVDLGESWKVERRAFQVERTGEYTRGMLVVDRRPEGEKSSVNTHHGTIALTEHQVPATIQVETEADIPPQPSGIQCIVQTPGPRVLLDLILSQVWGIDSQ